MLKHCSPALSSPNELPPTSYLENPRCLVSRIKLPSSRVPDQESAAQPRCDSPKRAPMSSSRDAVSPQSRKWPRRSVGSEVMRRSEEHTSDIQSLMRIADAVFCL